MVETFLTPTNFNQLPKLATNGNLPSRIENVIIEAIQTGTLRAGERLLVDRIAEHFGVSKIPVREAFKALEVAGYLEALPRRGTFVKSLSLEELAATFETRRLIEPHCAYLAAKRRTNPQLHELKTLVESGNDATKQNDGIRISTTNRSFHTGIAIAANNELLSSLVIKVQHRLRRYFIAANWYERHASLTQHQGIYEAIRDQNANLAHSLMAEHIDHTESLARESQIISNLPPYEHAR